MIITKPNAANATASQAHRGTGLSNRINGTNASSSGPGE